MENLIQQPSGIEIINDDRVVFQRNLQCFVPMCPTYPKGKCSCANTIQMIFKNHLPNHISSFKSFSHNLEPLFHRPKQDTKISAISFLEEYDRDLTNLKESAILKISQGVREISNSLKVALTSIDNIKCENLNRLKIISSTDKIQLNEENDIIKNLLLKPNECLKYLLNFQASLNLPVNLTQIIGGNLYELHEKYLSKRIDLVQQFDDD